MMIDQTAMDKQKERLNMLRKRRARIAEAKSSQERVIQYSPKIISSINSVFGKTLYIDDFGLSIQPLLKFRWSESLDVCEGLVIAHTKRSKIANVLACCGKITGELSGLIGIEGCMDMGFAELTEINIVKLISVAESLNDSVLFYPRDIQGVLLVDCYEVLGSGGSYDYSIVVQGNELEKKLFKCFKKEKSRGHPEPKSRGQCT